MPVWENPNSLLHNQEQTISSKKSFGNHDTPEKCKQSSLATHTHTSCCINFKKKSEAWDIWRTYALSNFSIKLDLVLTTPSKFGETVGRGIFALKDVQTKKDIFPNKLADHFEVVVHNKNIKTLQVVRQKSERRATLPWILGWHKGISCRSWILSPASRATFLGQEHTSTQFVAHSPNVGVQLQVPQVSCILTVYGEHEPVNVKMKTYKVVHVFLLLLVATSSALMYLIIVWGSKKTWKKRAVNEKHKKRHNSLPSLVHKTNFGTQRKIDKIN